MTSGTESLDDEETLVALIDVARRAFEKARVAKDADLLQQAIHLIVKLEKRLEVVRRPQRKSAH